MCDFPTDVDDDDDIIPPDCRWCVPCGALFRMSEWDAHLSSVAHSSTEAHRPDDMARKLDRLMDDVIGRLGL